MTVVLLPELLSEEMGFEPGKVIESRNIQQGAKVASFNQVASEVG